MYGEDMGTLQVDLTGVDGRDTVFLRSGSRDDRYVISDVASTRLTTQPRGLCCHGFSTIVY